MSRINPISPESTLAILIGVSTYQNDGFVDVPPIRKNIDKLVALLKDERVLGLQEDRILVFNGTESHDKILRGIRKFLKDASHADALIFYFAGHGHKTDKDEYFLATSNANKEDIDITAIPWKKIKNIFEKGKGIQQRIYLLDACYSGAAALTAENEAFDVAEGSALIAAAQANKKAYFDEEETYTYFTGALVELLEKGTEEKDLPAWNVDILADRLSKKLKRRNGKFQIVPKTSGSIKQTGFFKNVQHEHWRSRKHILKNIEKARMYSSELDFRMAKLVYLEAKDEIGENDWFEDLRKTIEDELKEVKFLQRHKKKFEDFYRGQMAEKEEALKETKRRLAEVEAALAEEQKALSDSRKAEEVARQAMQKLQAEKEKLKAREKAQKKALQEARAAISRLEEENEKLKKELKQWRESAKPPFSTNEYVEKINDDVSFTMVFVEGGKFTMGCLEGRDEGCYDNEKPPHEVELSDFYIGQTPVTQKLWRAVMGSDPPELYNKGCDDCPVERVSWNDVQDFLKKLNAMTGQTYRLPTEAEWEYAARGGKKSRGYRYAGSNNLNEVGWYEDNYQRGKSYGAEGTTHPVGQRKPNELGLYDMSGNVWEWCQDWYDENYYEACEAKGVVRDPQGPLEGSFRVRRGGSWYFLAGDCRASSRRYWRPGYRGISLGFRLVRVP